MTTTTKTTSLSAVPRVDRASSVASHVSDRFMLWVLGGLIVLSPIVDVIIGLNAFTHTPSAAGKIVRGGWTLIASFYASEELLASRSRVLFMVSMPLLALSLVMFLREFAAAGLNNGLAAGLTNGLDAFSRPLYFVASLAVAYKLAVSGLLRPRMLANLYVCGGVILSIAIIAGGIGGLGVRNAYEGEVGAVSGTLFQNPATSAVPLILYCIMGLHGRRKVFAFLWIFAIAIVEGMTGNRAGMLEGAVAAVTYAAVVPRGDKSRVFGPIAMRLAGVLLLIALSVTVIGIWFPGVLFRFGDTGGSGRTTFQGIVLEDIAGRSGPELLLGKGRMDVISLLSKTYSMEIYSHNDFLEIMAGYGVVGLTPFVLGVGALGYACFRRAKSSVLKVECCSVFIGWLAVMLTEVSYENEMFTLLLGAMLGTMIAYRWNSSGHVLAET